MSHVIKFKRGQADDVDAYTPVEGEPVFDLERKELRVGDGLTVGGHVLGRAVSLDSQVVDTGVIAVDTIVDTVARGAIWHYVVDKGDGANMRTGRIQACWDREEDGAIAPIPEEASPDIGTTLEAVSFSIEKDGHDVQLKCEATSDDWTVDLTRILIG